MRHYGPDIPMPIVRDSIPTPGELLMKQLERDLWWEWGSEIVYWRDVEQKFRADKPISFEDVEGGGYCSRSGFWFPARRIVNEGGVKTGDKFYREDPDA